MASTIRTFPAHKRQTSADGGTTNNSPTVTSASASFTVDDVGRTIEGTNIPAGAKIAIRNSATSVDMDVNATADGTMSPGTSNLLEVPVSAALNRTVPAAFERLCGRSLCAGTTRSLLERLGAVRVQWLRPFSSTLDDMCALARRLQREGVPLLNLFLNSSEASMGADAAVRTSQDLDRRFSRLEDVLAYVENDLGAIPVTFSEFRSLYCGAQSEPPS